MDKGKLIRKFDKQAKMYEVRRRKRTEKVWRERLIRCARGSVLEVGVGAGANFPFYEKSVSVTAVDFSNEMLSRAKLAAIECSVRAEFMQSDIESLDFSDHSFDTIVSTLTLCGYDDPIAVLKKFNRWVKADGQILLMEHGVSSNRILGFMQKVVDPLFVKTIGCHQNRDMKQIFHQSGIEIMETERHLLGMVHLVWAKPSI